MKVRSGMAALSRAFTLLELLVVVGIMGAMVTVGIVSVRSGQGAVRIKGATRDVFAAIRSARSRALVTQQPVIITYSTVEKDGEPVAMVEITSATLMSTDIDLSKVRTITGAPLNTSHELVHIEKADDAAKDVDADVQKEKEGGDTLEGTLFEPINAEVVKGMRIKAVTGEDALGEADAAHRPRVSVFSNVDFLLGRFKDWKSSTAASAESEQDKKPEENPAAGIHQEPVSVIWEPNGRVDAHQVWIYPDGKRPEDGLSIKVDSFGAAKVLSGDGRED